MTASLWLNLELIYRTRSRMNRLLLKSRLHDLNLAEGKPIKPHLDELDSIVMDFQNINVKLDNEDMTNILLCSLPPEYRHFRETVLYGRDEITLEDVKNALLQRELKEKQLIVRPDASQGEGLVIRGRSNEKNLGEKQRPRSKSINKNILSHGCKKKRSCKEVLSR